MNTRPATMKIISLLLATCAVLLPPKVVTAQQEARQVELRPKSKIDDSNCQWIQTYLDISINNCIYINKSLLIVPSKRISNSVAIDIVASAAVAAEMQKRSPDEINVALDPTSASWIKVNGKPVRYFGLDDPKKARRELVAKVIHCRMKNWDEICSDGSSVKLVPVQ